MQVTGSEHRNHCPHCLHSKHVDLRPGDRLSACGGEMEPIAVWVRTDGEWSIIHRCRRCTSLKSNRIAGDDCQSGLLRLAARPLAHPPFSLDDLETEETDL
ncbi:MAG: RNHCP domain-containing protein [Myxococcales bacterium]